MSDLVIRHANPADIPRLRDLLGELFRIETDFTPDLVKQTQGLTLLVHDTSGGSAVFVAVADGMVVGMATIQTLVSTAEGNRVGLVEDVIIDSRFRAQGIGALLLERLIAWSIEKNLKRLQLLVDCKNTRAVEFYSRHGWRRTDLHCMRLISG